jgi:hypothetical protein
VSAPNADAGTIALPDSSGAVFKAYLKNEDPAIYRYEGTEYGAPSSAGKVDGYDLIIENYGPAIAGVSYSVTGQGGLTVTATDESAGYKLSGTAVSFPENGGIQFIPISVNLASGTDFGGADYIEPAIHVSLTKGSSVWEDDVHLRFYRERRYVVFNSDYPIRGYFEDPDGVAVPYSSGSASNAVSQIVLPYRSAAYKAMVFPDLVSPHKDNTGKIAVLYGARLSALGSSAVPSEAVPLISVYSQQSLGSTAEAGISSYSLNDSSEPNGTLGSGPTAYAGGSFHGYLTDGDYDAFLLDFSKADLIAAAATSANAYEFLYTGSMNDHYYASALPGDHYSGDGDGLLEPGEIAAVALTFRAYLDPSVLSGSYRAITLSASGGALLGTDPANFAGAEVNISASTADFLKYRDLSSATSYASERTIIAFVKVPAEADPRPQALVERRITLTLAVGQGAADSNWTYTCELPISE